jgi:hypothetical protein
MGIESVSSQLTSDIQAQLDLLDQELQQDNDSTNNTQLDAFFTTSTIQQSNS